MSREEALLDSEMCNVDRFIYLKGFIFAGTNVLVCLGKKSVDHSFILLVVKRYLYVFKLGISALFEARTEIF